MPILQIRRLRPREGNDLPKMPRTSIWVSHLCSRLPLRAFHKGIRYSLEHERKPTSLGCCGWEKGPFHWGSRVSGDVCVKETRCGYDYNEPQKSLSRFTCMAMAVLNPAVTFGGNGLPSRKTHTSPSVCKRPSPGLPREFLRPLSLLL